MPRLGHFTTNADGLAGVVMRKVYPVGTEVKKNGGEIGDKEPRQIYRVDPTRIVISGGADRAGLRCMNAVEFATGLKTHRARKL